MAQVAVLGGGFGGLAAAHELRRVLPAGDDVRLVSASETFFVGFAKLWDLVGARPLADGTASLHALAGHGIDFVHAQVTSVDPETRTVGTTEGELTADGLVIALGAGYQPAHTALLGPAVHNLYDAAALPGARADLRDFTAGRLVIAILGAPYLCPPAPFEAALLLNEWLRERGRADEVEVVVTTPAALTLPVAGADASRYLADRLGERGVSVWPEYRVTAIDHGARIMTFGDGSTFGYDLMFAVPAAAPPSVLASSPLAGGSGFVEPDPRTFRTAFDRVYAAGDCTTVPTATAQLPKAGVFAEAGGTVAARNLAADLHGGEPATFDGHGFCFLELPEQQVATISGDFYAEPAPDVTLRPPDGEAFDTKQRWERERLESWLG